MESDDIEIALHNNSTILLADGIGRLVETEKVFAFLKNLRFRGIEIFRFTAIQAAPTETDHTALTVMDGDDDAMTKTVVEAGTALAGDHKASCFKALDAEALDTGEMVQQAIPLIGRIAEPKQILRGR